MTQKTEVLTRHIEKLNRLSAQAREANKRHLDGDIFFIANVNFLTQSYVVMICAYVENYLKEITMFVLGELNQKLQTMKIPADLIKWNFDTNYKFAGKNDYTYNDLSLDGIKIEDLGSNFISASIPKTLDLFSKMGVKITDKDISLEMRDKIMSIVNTRNEVVHHNDKSSRITFVDIKDYVDIVIAYLTDLDALLQERLF